MAVGVTDPGGTAAPLRCERVFEHSAAATLGPVDDLVQFNFGNEGNADDATHCFSVWRGHGNSDKSIENLAGAKGQSAIAQPQLGVSGSPLNHRSKHGFVEGHASLKVLNHQSDMGEPHGFMLPVSS